ncbi:MAG: hypothetical protein CMJ74_12760 [Planctomycetaceae bacterium]|nr:hypothetical protein [Planctomycetaceae bacterium]|tara:strand:+ start:2690 stop:2890 length:201 start_codon:yes stop_codon:yes gene_type:complete
MNQQRELLSLSALFQRASDRKIKKTAQSKFLARCSLTKRPDILELSNTQEKTLFFLQPFEGLSVCV